MTMEPSIEPITSEASSQSVLPETKKQSSENGRPTKKTTELVQKLIEAFHDDATIEQACYIAGIWKTTYYNWLKDDDDFLYEMTKAQEYPKVLAKRVLFKAIANGDEKIALEVIKRREKDRYSDRTENTGKDGRDIAPTFVVATKEAKEILEQLYERPNSTNDEGVSR